MVAGTGGWQKPSSRLARWVSVLEHDGCSFKGRFYADVSFISCKNWTYCAIIAESTNCTYIRIKKTYRVLYFFPACISTICSNHGQENEIHPLYFEFARKVQQILLVWPQKCTTTLIRKPYHNFTHRQHDTLQFPFIPQTIEELEKEMLNGQKLQGPYTALEVNHMLKDKNMEDRWVKVLSHEQLIGVFHQ